jgi:hypothetical protein
MRWWVRRDPHTEWLGLVVAHDTEMGVLVDASLDLRDRQSGICSDNPMVEELRGAFGPTAGYNFNVPQHW